MLHAVKTKLAGCIVGADIRRVAPRAAALVRMTPEFCYAFGGDSHFSQKTREMGHPAGGTPARQPPGRRRYFDRIY
jgi:hypothetical protein